MDSKNLHLLTMGDAADRLQVEPHTLRRWVKYHRSHLSQYAKPTHSGRARRFTERDLQVLSAVRSLRLQGLTVEQVNDRLADTTFGEVEPLQAPVAAQASPQQEPSSLVVVEALQSIQTHLESLAPLSARMDALEQAQQAQRLRIDVTIIAVAAFVAGLILGLAVWWFQ